MAYLDVCPMIVAFSTSPGDFEMKRGWLHHKPSLHRFRFEADGSVRLDANCDCSRLAIDPSQRAELSQAFRSWLHTHWRPLEINREFASHFAEPMGWRRIAHRMVEWLDRLAHRHHSAGDATVTPLMAVE